MSSVRYSTERFFPVVIAAAVLLSTEFMLGDGRLLAAEPTRSNVLFLFSDDQRFDTIRSLGNDEIETPNLDQLVQRGTAFTRAFIMGGDQPAVCVPSRAMMLSGRSLFHITPQLKDAPLWPELLGQHGYATCGIGKWHNGAASYTRTFNTGGPVFFGGMSNQFQTPIQDFDPDGKYPKQRQRLSDKHSSELFADSAIEFLKSHRGDKPFCLYVAFTSPHDPRTAPKEFHRRYDLRKISLPKNFLPEHPFDNGELKIRDEQLLKWPRTPEAVRQEIADYYAMITHLDAQIGRILGALDETGQGQNTLLIFAGDNGLAVGQHGLLGKQNLYDHSVRVPLIVAGPGVPPGRRSDALVYLFDLFPTIAEVCGVAVPDKIEGSSLVPVLKGDSQKVRDVVFAAYRDVQRMVRTDRWKLIRYPKIDRTQLFDLAKDPAEMTDLSADPALVQQRQRLEKLLAESQAGLDDPLAKFSRAERIQRPK